MQLTYNWLKKYLDNIASLEKVEEALSNNGLEVESIDNLGKKYEPFIIAEILEATQHPNADKLRVCTVFDGAQNLQVVCGAPNARKGIKVVLAPIGAYIPAHDFVIKKSAIRGVESQGMMCSYDELSLEGDSEGIIELPADAPVGGSFAQYYHLNDAAIDISVTPNRGDALSVLGVARDLYAAGCGELKAPIIPDVKFNSCDFVIKNNTQGDVYEFNIAVIRNLSQHAFDTDLARKYKNAGYNLNAPLVNISNYTMVDLGRPNHIYDLDKIKGDMELRYSREGESFIALGGTEYKLPEGILIIADSEKVLAIAGVMGGELSKVDENTKNIAVEVANFNKDAVLKSGRALNIHTDSRYRFERRVDHGITSDFLKYLVGMLIDNCGGELIGASHIQPSLPNYMTEIAFDTKMVEKMAGVKVSDDEINAVLARLGFTKNGAKYNIPSYRQGDISLECDLVEEFLRIWGLKNITSEILPLRLSKPTLTSEALRLRNVQNALIKLGFKELVTLAFVSELDAKTFEFADSISLQNPISEELKVMRCSLLPSLIKVASQNIRSKERNFKLFEIGKTYFKNKESLAIAGLFAGEELGSQLGRAATSYNYFDAKQIVENIVTMFGFDSEKLVVSNEHLPSYLHPYRSARFMVGNKCVAIAGQLHPALLDQYDFISAPIVFEIYVDTLPKIPLKNAKQFLKISKYPEVERDFAFVVSKEAKLGDILKSVKKLDDNIKDVMLFDIYSKSTEDEDQSFAFKIKLQSFEATFTDEQIKAISEKVIDHVARAFNCTLR